MSLWDRLSSRSWEAVGCRSPAETSRSLGITLPVPAHRPLRHRGMSGGWENATGWPRSSTSATSSTAGPEASLPPRSHPRPGRPSNPPDPLPPPARPHPVHSRRPNCPGVDDRALSEKLRTANDELRMASEGLCARGGMGYTWGKRLFSARNGMGGLAGRVKGQGWSTRRSRGGAAEGLSLPCNMGGYAAHLKTAVPVGGLSGVMHDSPKRDVTAQRGRPRTMC